jgi:hypothetical protein
MKHHVFSNVLKVDFFSFLKTLSLTGLQQNNQYDNRIEFYQFHPEIDNQKIQKIPLILSNLLFQ